MLSRLDYIAKFSGEVVASTIGTALFPSVMMAQAIIESSNGNSSLALNHNNHFGIKADSSWKGEVVDFNTREVYNGKDAMVNAGFRKYATAKAGFKDRNKFLMENPRYTKAGVFAAKTPEEQAQALQKAGYATDPNYASLLIKVINQHGLKELDKKKILGTF